MSIVSAYSPDVVVLDLASRQVPTIANFAGRGTVRVPQIGSQ